MLANGDADAMVTGVTRNFSAALGDVQRVIDPKPGHRLMGVSLVLSRGRTVIVADTAITEMPDAEDLAAIAVEAARVARRLGTEPRVALLAFSTFGHPPGERSGRVKDAVRILDAMHVDFEYDGEMAAEVALNRERMAAYPFCRLKDVANVLVMPAFHSASISTHMLQELGGATLIGPMIVGLDRPVQILPLGARDADIVNMAALAAFNATPVRFTAVANLRVKECDRLHALATELDRFSPGLAREEGDELVVEGEGALKPPAGAVRLRTYADHRMAMSLALLGLQREGVVIEDPGCVAKTFPAYWDTLRALGVRFSPEP